MRNLDTNTYLTKPELEVVESKKENVTGATFILWADLAGAPPEDEVDPNKPKNRIAAGG
jgi:hypothetical protein